ncbi:MAG: membrane protein insertion efficiency factor YidD [Candidatus Riflebacteria bacterium]|nr:membrane protein insertion efficiency factor YidD [Candidatus Riflebacteria bacterium]
MDPAGRPEAGSTGASSSPPATAAAPAGETPVLPLSWAARASLDFIRWYQRWLSPFVGQGCRFQPTCSRYTHEAISRYGFWRGWGMGLWRILRCNPFCRGGDDPVP